MDDKTWQEQGLAHYRAGAYAEAIEAFANAKAAYEAAGDQGNAAEMLNNQGVAYRMLRQWDKAEAAFLEAQVLFARLGDDSRRAQATANLGMLAHTRGQTKQAAAFFEEAIAAFQTLGDRVRESDTRRALSKAYLKQRRWPDALAAYSAALDCAPRLSLGQRFLRWLFRLPLRLLGGG
jgi:tetratricopeptide (TPR) repeat protein